MSKIEVLWGVVKEIFPTWGGGGGFRKEMVTASARVTMSQE
jgi:hypothetical protein